MRLQDYHTYNEIKTQTEAWAQALDVTHRALLPNPANYEQVIFTGCGSTYYLSLAAAALYQELTRRPARAVPGGELLLNPEASVAQTSSLRYLLVAISRSGTTTETVKATEQFKREQCGNVAVISNYQETLSRLADFDIVIPKGQEESVAQTRSFASMYVAVTAFCARMAGNHDLLEAMKALPEAGARLMAKYEPLAREIGENLDFDRFYFLGSGIRYGLACEVNLKMKEMTLTHSEPFHFLEFRHGPMSMVGKSSVVCGLLSDANRVHEAKVLEEMKMLGAAVAALGESEADVSFESGIPESVRGVLYLPVLQLMAFHRSLKKGLNPDRPTNLTTVVKLDM